LLASAPQALSDASQLHSSHATHASSVPTLPDASLLASAPQPPATPVSTPQPQIQAPQPIAIVPADPTVLPLARLQELSEASVAAYELCKDRSEKNTNMLKDRGVKRDFPSIFEHITGVDVRKLTGIDKKKYRESLNGLIDDARANWTQ